MARVHGGLVAGRCRLIGTFDYDWHECSGSCSRASPAPERFVLGRRLAASGQRRLQAATRGAVTLPSSGMARRLRCPVDFGSACQVAVGSRSDSAAISSTSVSLWSGRRSRRSSAQAAPRQGAPGTRSQKVPDPDRHWSGGLRMPRISRRAFHRPRRPDPSHRSRSKIMMRASPSRRTFQEAVDVGHVVDLRAEHRPECGHAHGRTIGVHRTRASSRRPSR